MQASSLAGFEDYEGLGLSMALDRIRGLLPIAGVPSPSGDESIWMCL